MSNPFFEKLVLKIAFQQKKIDTQQSKKYKAFKYEFETLAVLKSGKKENRKVYVSELAGIHDMPMSGVSRLLKNMEEKGLLTRETDPADRRNTIITITTDGEVLYRKMLDTSEKYLMDIFSVFSEEERRTYMQLTAKLYGLGNDCKE